LAIARTGKEVVGIDLSPKMLKRAREKAEAMGLDDRTQWVEGSMTTFELDRRFPLVIIPYRSFLHLMTVKEQLAALKRIRQHLHPGGMLALNVFVPSLVELHEIEGKNVHRGTFPIPGTAECVEVHDITEHDPFRQWVRVIRFYERYDESGRLLERLRTVFQLRYIFPTELFHLLRLAGFQIVGRYGTFDRGPFDHRSTELIVEAKKMET
jgi:ubiquinone/menaquinone biosynthesis C-methylase UbiE